MNRPTLDERQADAAEREKLGVLHI